MEEELIPKTLWKKGCGEIKGLPKKSMTQIELAKDQNHFLN